MLRNRVEDIYYLKLIDNQKYILKRMIEKQIILKFRSIDRQDMTFLVDKIEYMQVLR